MKRFIFTFGQNHAHRVNNQTFDKDSVAVVLAKDERRARQIVFEAIGDKWAFSYAEEDFDSDGSIKYFPRGKMNFNF